MALTRVRHRKCIAAARKAVAKIIAQLCADECAGTKTDPVSLAGDRITDRDDALCRMIAMHESITNAKMSVECKAHKLASLWCPPRSMQNLSPDKGKRDPTDADGLTSKTRSVLLKHCWIVLRRVRAVRRARAGRVVVSSDGGRN